MILRLAKYSFSPFSRYCTIAKLLADGPQNSSVTFQGWILHRREHKNHNFVVVSDGLTSDTVQVVVEKSKLIPEMKPGAAVSITGNLIPSGGRGQKYDFIPEKVDIIGNMDSQTYPFGGTEKCEEGTVRQYLHLRPKMLSFSSLLRLRNFAKNWIHQYLQEQNFLCIDTPVITLNDCEGGGEAFYVEPADKVKFGDALIRETGPDGVETESKRYFFNRPAYTTVSGQLHLEAAACAFRRVYTFNPTFRAESCDSRNHLAEFYMLEIEMAFVNDLEPFMKLAEDLLRKCSEAIIDQNATDYAFYAKYHNAKHMKVIEKTLSSNQPFARISYNDAVAILEKGVAENLFPKPAKLGFTKQQEHYLVSHFGNLPVFVLDFPAASKPFYMARKKDDPETVSCFDFLAPLSGEIVGGSLREGDYDALENRLASLGVQEKLHWYLDLRKYGYPHTGGFGFGLERYLQWLLGVNNIKDCLPFPRWYGRCYM